MAELTLASDYLQSASAKFDSPQQEVFLNLWRTFDRLRVFEDELFSRFDLTAQQYNVLRLLGAAHPSPIRTLHLASRLVSKAPDITRMLDKLEEQGWITRSRFAENRRVVQVGITEAGLNLLEQIAGPLEQCHQQQLGHMSAEKLRSLAELLRLARRPHESTSGAWGTVHDQSNKW